MVKKVLYLSIWNKIKEGKNQKQISKELNIKQQNVSYYLRRLKKLGIVRKLGYGVWETTTTQKKDLEHALSKSSKKIRGHAFIWKIKLGKKYDWIKILDNLNINYSLIRGYTPRIVINKRKIWLGKKSVIIYDPYSYYGKNAIESRKHSIISFLEIVDTLKRKIGVNLRGLPFTISREHYGMIKNDLAIQCNRNGEKIYVSDDKEGEWLWIDDSHSLGELETGGKRALTRSIQVQNWWNDNKKYDFKVTPSFLLEQINKVTQNQLMFNENFESHVGAVTKLGNSADANARTTELLADVVKDLVMEVKNLKKEIRELRK